MIGFLLLEQAIIILMGNNCQSMCDPLLVHESKEFQSPKRQFLQQPKDFPIKQSSHQTIINKLRKLSDDSKALELYSTCDVNSPQTHQFSRIASNYMENGLGLSTLINWNPNLIHTYYYTDGSEYEGMIKQSCYHGFGKLRRPNGDVYEGEWCMGKQHNRGKQIYADGSSYQGNFVYGKRDGQGVFVSADGGCYMGEWKDGMMNGLGSYTWLNGNSYTGSWISNQMDGQGFYSYVDGSTYKGSFVKGKRQGFGILLKADGNVYSGYWMDDVQHGQGEVETNGERVIGVWQKGKLL